MSEKTAKKKAKKSAKAADTGVLGNLRSTRPTRLGGDRRAGATRSRGSAAATTAATKSSAKTSAKTSAPKPQPVKSAIKRSPKPKAKRPTEPPPADGRRATPPRGPEIVTTAVQAAGELAQIGLTVSGQILKRASRRLPRP